LHLLYSPFQLQIAQAFQSPDQTLNEELAYKKTGHKKRTLLIKDFNNKK